MAKIKLIMADIRRDGLNAAVRKHGWRIGAVIFVVYLIRDVTIYLILPAMVASL